MHDAPTLDLPKSLQVKPGTTKLSQCHRLHTYTCIFLSVISLTFSVSSCAVSATLLEAWSVVDVSVMNVATDTLSGISYDDKIHTIHNSFRVVLIPLKTLDYTLYIISQ